jgi:hypothetical protein
MRFEITQTAKSIESRPVTAALVASRRDLGRASPWPDRRVGQRTRAEVAR